MSGCPDRATLGASTPHFACAGGVVDMVSSIEDRDVASADVAMLPLAPRNPLPLWRQLTAARAFHTGPETLRDAGGPVTRVILGPKRLMPPGGIVTSPHGARGRRGRCAVGGPADGGVGGGRARGGVRPPPQRRARAANASLHRLAAEILQTCRADPDRDAPLVRALLAACDPQTGRPLYDD